MTGPTVHRRLRGRLARVRGGRPHGRFVARQWHAEDRPGSTWAWARSGGKVRVFHTASPLASAFGVSSIQVVTGTLVSGLCTITVGVGQSVTPVTRAIPFMQAVVTGSTNVGTLTHMYASNVAGGNGVGQVLFRMLGNDGATDVDAAGAFAALLIN